MANDLDLAFQFVAGVHPVSSVGSKSHAPEGSHRRDFNGGHRSWDVLPENDHIDDKDSWRYSGQSINELLYAHLRDLQDRATDEAIRNPIVEGVLTKHRVDVIGEHGPTLQVEPIDWDGEAYATAVERLFAEVAEAPTADGEESLADWLGIGLEADWTKGGSIDQLVYDADVDHPIKTRLFPIEIERLETPTARTGDDNTLLGITRNKYGRPTNYWIAEERKLYQGFSVNHTRIDAAFMMHCYHRRFTAQVRGVPRLASALAAIAELRKYDVAVMDLAQMAAMLGVLVYTTSEMVDSPTNMESEMNKPLKLQRRGITRLPYHHQAEILHNNQPPPQYKDFRHERSRDIGRPMAMPQLAVQMDASGHNYSSARFDDRGYWRANQRLQAMFAKKRLNPFARRVIREAEALRLVPRRAGPIKLVWQWPKSDGIDPVKDAMGRQIRMQNYSTSPIRVAMEEGADFEQICKEWRRAMDIMKANGLPPEIAGMITDPDLYNATKTAVGDRPRSKPEWDRE